jgi:hypothetical protein
MPVPLKPLGPATIGRSISFGIKADSDVGPSRPNNRIITVDYEMRTEDASHYIENIENPTLYHQIFTSALIVGQSVQARADDKTTCILTREFAEVPFEWNERVERVETFYGVAATQLYAPGEFFFRNQMVSIRTDCRVNRRYFISTGGVPGRFEPFRPVDQDGSAVSVMSDYTTPSADEYIAMVLGRQEIVVSSAFRRWKGAIHVLETVYAQAK